MKKLLLVLVLAAMTLTAVADTTKLSPELQNYTGSVPVKVVVQYSQAPSLLDLNGVLNLGGQLLSTLGLNDVVALLTGPQLLNLSNQSNVIYISPDRPVLNLLSNAAPAINA